MIFKFINFSKLKIYLVIQAKDQIYSDLQNLIDEYSSFSDKLSINWTDPVKNPSKTEELIYLYKLNSYPAIKLCWDLMRKFLFKNIFNPNSIP